VVGKLLSYHIVIAAKGLTTYQDIKKNYANDPEYHADRGICQNFSHKLFYRNRQAYFKPNGVYEVNYLINNINDTDEAFYASLTKGDRKKQPMTTFPNSTNQKTIISRTLSNEYKVQPGELHQSEGDGGHDFPRIITQGNMLTSKIEVTSQNNDFENDSLNKKIFSIIDSSGTIEDNDKSDGILIY
jgi:hypothetical protein